MIQKLSGAWKGADSDKFTQMMNRQLIPKFKKASAKITKYGEMLQNVQSKYQELDSDYSSKAIDE